MFWDEFQDHVHVRHVLCYDSVRSQSLLEKKKIDGTA